MLYNDSGTLKFVVNHGYNGGASYETAAWYLGNRDGASLHLDGLLDGGDRVQRRADRLRSTLETLLGRRLCPLPVERLKKIQTQATKGRNNR